MPASKKEEEKSCIRTRRRGRKVKMRYWNGRSKGREEKSLSFIVEGGGGGWMKRRKNGVLLCSSSFGACGEEMMKR